MTDPVGLRKWWRWRDRKLGGLGDNGERLGGVDRGER